MQFIPENKLEEALVRAATDPTSRPEFYKIFAESDIYIVEHGVGIPIRSGRRTLSEGYQLQMQPIEYNGRVFIPVFSSLKRLESFVKREVAYLALNATEFLKLIGNEEIVLNPGCDYGKEFLQNEIAALIAGSIDRPVQTFVTQKATQVLIGQPANYPEELVAALKKWFATNKLIKKAYLAHFQNPEVDPKPHTLIGIEVAGDWRRATEGIGIVVDGCSIPDPPVDTIQVKEGGSLYDYFRTIKPFYERKAFGPFRL